MSVKETTCLKYAFTTRNDSITNRLLNKSKVWVDGHEYVAATLWDTGATNSCVSKNVVKELCLSPVGAVRMQTPSGEDVVNTYLVNITLPNNVVIEDIIVADSEIHTQGLDVLIGMDIINRGDFAVTNHDGKTVFSFCLPSTKTIDFSKEIAVSNVIGQRHGPGKRRKKK